MLFSERFWNYLTVGRLRIAQYVRVVAMVMVLVIGGYVGDKLVGQAHQAYAAANYYKIKPTIDAARLARQSDGRFASTETWQGALDAFSAYVTPHATVCISTPDDTLFLNNMCSQAAHAHDEVCQRDVTIPLNGEDAAKPVSERVPD